MSEDELRFETRAIHAGQEPDPATGAVTVPIYQTSLFVQDDVERDRGWFYSRTGNPTRAALERCIASLEGAATLAAAARLREGGELGDRDRVVLVNSGAGPPLH